MSFLTRRSDPSRKITIQIFSEIHMELQDTYSKKTGPHNGTLPKKAEYIFLAGDVGNLVLPHQRASFENWLAALCVNYKYVFYVAGNHEYWFGTIAARNAELKQLAALPAMRNRLVCLENERFDIPSTNATVLGCVLCSRLILAQGKVPGGRIGDAGWIRGDIVKKHLARVEYSYCWIKDQVKAIREEDKNRRIVVMTHYCPMLLGSTAPVNELRGSWSNWQTDILGGEGIDGLHWNDVWIHGHTHYSHDSAQDGVRVISNSRGRKEENSRFGLNRT